jgi:apolipoprotein N-acyltransferase
MTAQTALAPALSRLRPNQELPKALFSLPWALFASALSGAVLCLAFPPVGVWALAPVAVAMFTLTLRGRKLKDGAILGLIAGLGLFLPLLAWLRVVGLDAWLVLASVQSLYIAVMGAGLVAVSRLPAWPVWTASVWVAQELVRDRWPLGGFSWGRLAFSQGNTPFTGFAAWAGAPLVTFAVALSGACLAAVVVSVVRRRNWPAVVAVAAAVVLPLVALAIPRPTSGRMVTAAVVQGNVPHPGLHYLGRPLDVLTNHVEETNRLADAVAAGTVPKPDFVIWPENASDLDPITDPTARALIDHSVARIGVPTLVGGVLNGPGPNHVRNAGVVWDPTTGPGDMYVKRHLVPFGEYIPFRSVIGGLVGEFSLIPHDFVPGHTTGDLRLGPATVGDVICFEVAYDGNVRDAVTHGGQIIVVQTNNATYGRTGQTQQQLAMSQLRAVEHGRAVLIAATSGISAVIAPDGHVMAATREFVPASLVQQVPLRDTLTIADHVGAVPEWFLAALGLAAVAAGIAVGRRPRMIPPGAGKIGGNEE